MISGSTLTNPMFKGDLHLMRSLRVVSFSKEASQISYMATTRAWRGWDYSMGIGTLCYDCMHLNESNYMFSSINCARCDQSSIFGFGLSNMADFVTNIIIKLPHYGVTLCFQFFSTAVSVCLRRNEMTFASYVKTVCAAPQICGTKKV